MLKALTLMAAALALSGCDKPPQAVATCRPPVLVQHASLKSYAGQRERADHCVKAATYDLTRAGGAVAKAASDALARCAPQEADAVTALAREGHAWSYQRTQIHEDLEHLASLTAIQARSIGCGLAPGEDPDTLMSSGTR
jgi:hypothetical protein